MNLVDRLEAEHQVFLRQLDELEQCLDSSGTDQLQILQGSASLLHAALEYHAECEEKQLFPNLVPHLGSSGGPIQVMNEEHNMLRHEADIMLKTKLSNEAIAPVTKATRAYISILRDHIAKEDGVLFPMSRSFLSQDRLNELDSTCPHVKQSAPSCPSHTTGEMHSNRPCSH